jgi:hypothetical protein
MRPHPILRHLPVALFVTLGLLTRDSRGVARAEPALVKSDQPRIVGISPLGTTDRRQIFQVLINRRSGDAIAFGYFNYIHGLDEDELYLEDSRKPESKAFVTLYIEAKITRVHRDGPLIVYEAKGHSTIFFDGTPDGDFSNPDTFRNGTPIATGEENNTFTLDPETGIGTGDVRLRQTAAFPFEFKGERIQFGEVGNHNVTWRGKTRRIKVFGWTRLAATATTVQAAPLQAIPPP